jgi:hypothetical protein
MWEMPGPRFIRLAQRIHAYDGAVTALIRTELASGNQQQVAAPRAVPAAVPAARPAAGAPGVRVVGATRGELMMSEELSGLISFGTA